jgi:CDP-diacylglycerol pyrophosphatase
MKFSMNTINIIVIVVLIAIIGASTAIIKEMSTKREQALLDGAIIEGKCIRDYLSFGNNLQECVIKDMKKETAGWSFIWKTDKIK